MRQLAEVKEAAVAGDGPWLTPIEAAEILGVHPNTVRKFADEGLLDEPEPVWRLGRHRKISQKSAERLRDVLRGRQA
jgi:excisionase family DNA binding protein